MQRRIFLVDDEAEIASVIGRYLRLKKWAFESVSRVEDARAGARSFAPDLILLDVQIGTSSGWDLCRELKKDPALGHVPVVMLSGAMMSPEDKARGIEVGADDYMTKPVELPELVLRVENILKTVES